MSLKLGLRYTDVDRRRYVQYEIPCAQCPINMNTFMTLRVQLQLTVNIWQKYLMVLANTTNAGVWLCPVTKPDGEKYYEYILCYIDDILGISHDPVPMLRSIRLPFKDYKIEDPEFYLGAKLEKKIYGKRIWIMTCKDCIHVTVSNIKILICDD